MAIRTSFTAGEVLAAADLNDTFGAKLDLAGGKILQIVRATDTTDRTTTSTVDVDVTGMSVTITPQKSNSAVIVIASFSALAESTNATINRDAFYTITDSSNNALSGAQSARLLNTVVGLHVTQNLFSVIGYSTPATTSPVTYKLRQRTGGLRITGVMNGGTTGQMYAIEVSA